MNSNPHRWPFPKQKRKPVMVTLGTCTVPDGVSGDWTISTFTLTKEEVAFDNMRNAINGYGFMRCLPGEYRCLRHKMRGVVMTNTPMEVRTNRVAFQRATGRVLIMGLGLGMLLEAIMSKPDVTFVRVVEKEQDVIDLVAPHFASYVAEGRLEVVKGDALEYKLAKDERWDYVWCDIWDTISEDNLPQMAKFSRRFNKRRADGIDHWARPEIRQMKKRYFR